MIYMFIKCCFLGKNAGLLYELQSTCHNFKLNFLTNRLLFRAIHLTHFSTGCALTIRKSWMKSVTLTFCTLTRPYWVINDPRSQMAAEAILPNIIKKYSLSVNEYTLGDGTETLNYRERMVRKIRIEVNSTC